MNVYQLSAKNCMSHLLLKDTFDNFSFIEGEITTFNFLTAHGLTGYRPEEIRGLYLNFHYDGHHLQCITGTSLNTFTMDKSIEREWDQEVKNILKSRSIEGDY